MTEGHTHDEPQGDRFDEMVSWLELEGEVLDGFVTAAIAVLCSPACATSSEIRRIVDLGSGPGVSTSHLVAAFPAATIVAADRSVAMLARVEARAERDGLADRVETVVVDLGAGFDTLADVDLVWASMSLHHVSDPSALLDRIRAVLRPEGLVCIIERGEMTSIQFTDELGRPGLWDRLDGAWQSWFDAEVRGQLHGVSSYGALLAAGGFEVLADTTLHVTLEPPLNGPASRFVRQHLERRLHALEGSADAADLVAVTGWFAEHDAADTRNQGSYRETLRLSIGRRR